MYYSATLASVASFLVMNIIIFRRLEYKLYSIKYDLIAYLTYAVVSIISTIILTRLSWGIAYVSSLKLVVLILVLSILINIYKIKYSQIKTIVIIPLMNYLPFGKKK
jgi:hypothetical protein